MVQFIYVYTLYLPLFGYLHGDRKSYTIVLDCTPLLSSAVLLPGPTNSRDLYILGHLAASKR